MSDSLNHYYCGRQSLAALDPASPICSTILRYYDAFRLGTQGPDFFFYGFPIARKKQPAAHTYGATMHRHHIDDFFTHAFAYADAHPQERDCIIAYLCGFACHHALDTATHPFIYYRTGFDTAQDLITPADRYHHKLLEVLLDVAFSQYEFGKIACFFKLEKIFTLTPNTEAVLANFFITILPEVYGLPTPSKRLITGSIHSIRRLAQSFGDAYGKKYAFVRRMERRFGAEYAASRVFYPEFTDELTVLNLGHQPWQHPVTGKSLTDSYPDCFDSAVQTTVERIQTIGDAYATGSVPDSDTIHALFGDASYLTALPCLDNQTMIHFDPIFHAHPQLLKHR